MFKLVKTKSYQRILETQTLESPPKFPCKANCLCDCCDDHLCRDGTCRAPPLHGHATIPCDNAGNIVTLPAVKSSWATLDSAVLTAEYEVTYGAVLRAAIECTEDFCPSQERKFFEMIDEAMDHGRMIVRYPECLDWNVDDVVKFIKTLGFPQFYEEGFRKNGIDGNKLYLCNSNRLVDMGIRDWKDVRIITKAIRSLLKIGYPKEETPLKEPRNSVQSLHEFWLRKRAFYSLGNEEKAKNYCFRRFLDEYQMKNPDRDEFAVFNIAAKYWMEKLLTMSRERRFILIQELRAAATPYWIESKNEMFVVKGVAEMPVPEANGPPRTTTKRASEESNGQKGEEKLVHFSEGTPEKAEKHRDSSREIAEKPDADENETISSATLPENRATLSADGKEDDNPPDVNVYAPDGGD